MKLTCNACIHRQNEPFKKVSGIPFFLCSKLPFLVKGDNTCQNNPSVWEGVAL